MDEGRRGPLIFTFLSRLAASDLHDPRRIAQKPVDDARVTKD